MAKVVKFEKKGKEGEKEIDKGSDIIEYGFGSYDNEEAESLMKKIMHPAHDEIQAVYEAVGNKQPLNIFHILALSNFMISNYSFFVEAEFVFIADVLDTLNQELETDDEAKGLVSALNVMLLINYYEIQDLLLKNKFRLIVDKKIN